MGNFLEVAWVFTSESGNSARLKSSNATHHLNRSMSDFITENSQEITSTRGFLKCMAWAGTGVFTPSAAEFSVPHAGPVANAAEAAAGASFNFVQISDSHIGFHKRQTRCRGTFAKPSRDQCAARSADFIIHTGDLTQLSGQRVRRSAADDQGLQDQAGILRAGEHDVLSDNGAQYLERFGKGTRGSGWLALIKKAFTSSGWSCDDHPGRRPRSARSRAARLAAKRSGQSSEEHAIVVFAHILVDGLPQWGWGTDDSAKALEFSSHLAPSPC